MPPSNPPPGVFAYTVHPSLLAWDVSPNKWQQKYRRHFDGLAVSVAVFEANADADSEVDANTDTDTDTDADVHIDIDANRNASTSQSRILLIQRAAHDSMPNRWEMPGGAADVEEDEGTLLRAAARELWEESGLVATRFLHRIPLPAGPGQAEDEPGLQTEPTTRGPGAPSPYMRDALTGGHIFTNRTGKRIFCRFAFAAQVDSTATVVLDPEEHQDYVWATEEEVRQERQLPASEGGSTAHVRGTTLKELPVAGGGTKALILEAFRLRQLLG